MLKLILSASLLLNLKNSSAQIANDKNQLIIAPYSICLNGLDCRDSVSVDDLLKAGGIQCNSSLFGVKSFNVSTGGGVGKGGCYIESNCAGSDFSQNSISIIKRLQQGSMLFIDEIVIENKKGQKFGVKPKILTIVNH